MSDQVLQPLSALLESIDDTILHLESSIKALNEVWDETASTKKRKANEPDSKEEAKHPCIYEGSETDDEEPPALIQRQCSSFHGF